MFLVYAYVLTEMPYLYNANQKVLQDCYTDETTLVYNKNIQQITVQITPTGAEACKQFPAGVEAYLILRDAANDIKSVVLNNFDYEKTTEIVFPGIADITDESFAVMHIFCYSLITQVDVFVFEEQKSALGSCYAYNSKVIIGEQTNGTALDQITIKLTSTKLCSQYINNITSTLSQVQLNILGTKITLEHQQFMDSYDSSAEITIQQFDVPSADILAVKSQALLTGALEFTSKQGTSEVTFMHTLGSISVLGKDFKVPNSDIDASDQAIINRFGPPQFWHPIFAGIGLWHDTFVCRAENHPLYEKYLSRKYDALNFTQYTVRLTAILGESSISIQNTTFKSHWDSSVRIFYFRCTQGAKDEQELCREFYKAAIKGGARYFLDVLFYQGNYFAFIEKIELAEVPSCWSDAVMQKRKNAICVQFLTRDNLDRCNQMLPENAYVPSLLAFQFMNLTDPSDFSSSEFFVKDIVTLSRKVAQYCIDCSALTFARDASVEFWRESCRRNREKLLKPGMMVNTVITPEDKSYSFGQSGLIVITARMTRTDYSVVQIVVFTLCGIAIAWCLVITIVGVIGIMRTLKQAKKKKAQ